MIDLRNSHHQLVGLIVFLLLLFLTIYWPGDNISMSWSLIASASDIPTIVHTFQKGIFTFELTGSKYVINEQYIGEAIAPTIWLTYGLVSFSWAGLCYFLAFSSFLKRYWFIGVGALFVFLVFQLQLDQFYGLGFNARWITLLVITSFIGPLYYFHAFRPESKQWFRTIILCSISIAWAWILSLKSPGFPEYLISFSQYGFSILTILFIFLIAEEIVFLILFLITRVQGGKNNEKHFVVFGFFYLLFLALYYAKKAGFSNYQIGWVDPFILLAITVFASIWTIPRKQSLFDSIFEPGLDIRHLFGSLACISLPFLTNSFAIGNDSTFLAFHYLIIYSFLGFGSLFFLYIIINFVNPISKGLRVYRIAYKEQNFPYVTARLAGLAAVAAFFFLSDKEPLKLIISGHYNHLSTFYKKEDQSLADRYLVEGTIYGSNNHFSNYQLGISARQNNDMNEAQYRFRRATRRNPTPHAFVNSSLASDVSDPSRLNMLRQGIVDFPGNKQIQNNLAVELALKGRQDEARELLAGSRKNSGWDQASLVNSYSLGQDNNDPKDGTDILEDFENGNLAVKSNIVALFPGDFNVDLQSFEQVDLHSTSLLVNTAVHKHILIPPSVFNLHLEQTSNQLLKDNLMMASISHYYLTDRVELAFRELAKHIASVSINKQAKLYNLWGKMALEQGSARLAVDHFSRAFELRHPESALNLGIALLEAGMWERAKSHWDTHLSADTVLYPEVSAVFDPEKNPANALHLYYRYKMYSRPEMYVALSSKETEFVETLWQKILLEKLDKNEIDNLKEYLDIIDQIAGNRRITAYESIFLQSIDTGNASTGITDNNDISGYNPFRTWSIVNQLDNGSFSDDKKYEALQNALEINPYSVILLKSYALQALDMGLYNYAENGLLRLYELIPRQEYTTFEQEFVDKKSERKMNTLWPD